MACCPGKGTTSCVSGRWSSRGQKVLGVCCSSTCLCSSQLHRPTATSMSAIPAGKPWGCSQHLEEAQLWFTVNVVCSHNCKLFSFTCQFLIWITKYRFYMLVSEFIEELKYSGFISRPTLKNWFPLPVFIFLPSALKGCSGFAPVSAQQCPHKPAWVRSRGSSPQLEGECFNEPLFDLIKTKGKKQRKASKTRLKLASSEGFSFGEKNGEPNAKRQK